MNAGFGEFLRCKFPFQVLTLILFAMFAAPGVGAETITGVVSDRLVSAGEKQYVTLSLAQDSVLNYTVNITGSSNIMVYTGVRDSSLRYYLSDADGGSARPRIGGNGSLEDPGGPFPLKAGNYAIELWRSPNANPAESYAWTVNTSVTAATRTNDSEPNDRMADALGMNAGSPVTGHLGYTDRDDSMSGSTDDGDWWKLTLAQSGSVSLRLSADASFTAVTASFKSSSGTPQNEVVLTPASTGVLSQTLSLGTLAAGTYYIEVYRGGATGYGGYGSYELELTAATSTTTTTTTSTTTTSTTTTTLAQPPSASMGVSGPLTSQTLTLQNIQIPSSDLSGGVSIYIVAFLGNTVVAFGPNGWTTQLVPHQSGVTAAPGPITLLNSMDLSGLVGVSFFFGYGNGSGDSALSDMLTKLKFAYLYTITAASSGGTNLLDLGLWNIYGSGHMQGTAIELGDEIGGDFGDEDKDGNPYNVWKSGAAYTLVTDPAWPSSSYNFGYDIDWMVSKETFSAPFTLLWNGCLSYGGPENRFFLGRKNAGFTNQASSPDPIAQEIYMEYQSGSGSTASLVAGTSAGTTVSMANLTTTKVTPGSSVPTRTAYDYDAICGDFKLEWKSQTVTSYFNGNKIGDLPYASGYGEPFAIGFRSFANPIKVNSFSVSQP